MTPSNTEPPSVPRAGRLLLNGVEQQERFTRRMPGSAEPVAMEFDWLRRALLPAAHASVGGDAAPCRASPVCVCERRGGGGGALACLPQAGVPGWGGV